MAVADGQVRITLIGSPRYLIRVEAYERERAEALLSEVIERMKSVLSGPGDELKVLEGSGSEKG
jgi:translation initiation factor 2 alpha subunit (eIF-2alpha)